MSEPTLAIVIENGVLTAVVSDGPLIGTRVLVIDYDTDKPDDDIDDILPIVQPDGRAKTAYVGYRIVEAHDGPMPRPLG